MFSLSASTFTLGAAAAVFARWAFEAGHAHTTSFNIERDRPAIDGRRAIQGSCGSTGHSTFVRTVAMAMVMQWPR